MKSESSIRSALRDFEKSLSDATVSEPKGSAEFLIRHVLGMTRSQLYANLDLSISKDNLAKIKKAIERRKKHEPVWQIVGQVEFWSMDFLINKNVLVPRPETELLIQEALKLIARRKLKILDVGTGSGAIICSLKRELPRADCFASDISIKALNVAKKNAKNLRTNVIFRKSNLFEAWGGQIFDVITANLPYVPCDNLAKLALDINNHEPMIALDGGESGLMVYSDFLKQLPKYLSKDGVVLCEIGDNQGEDFGSLVNNHLDGRACKIIKDFAGFDRIAIIVKKEDE